MVVKRDSAFYRRLESRRQVPPNISSKQTDTGGVREKLALLGELAQIILVVVAVFGYFYTVRPVYQKDRLEEQVAEFEGLIKEQKPKLENLVVESNRLRSEKDQLNAEKERLRSEISNVQKEMLLAKAEKKRIEDQTQYMAYMYHLPDGRPATTSVQVLEAQKSKVRENFARGTLWQCEFLRADDVFPSQYFAKESEEGSEFYPFTKREIELWRKEGAAIPVNRAVKCLETLAVKFEKENTSNPQFAGTVKEVVSKLRVNLEAIRAEKWTPPSKPEDLISKVKSAIQSARVEKDAEIKKVETEYGDWESVWGDSKRAIYKNNYEVGLSNAKVTEWNKINTAKWESQGEANKFRKSMDEEVGRLTKKATTGLSVLK